MLHADSGEARTLRDGLALQTLIITDVMQPIRALDISLASSLSKFKGVGLLLFGSSEHSSPELQEFRKKMQGMLLRNLVDQSGVGRIANLVREYESGDLDGNLSNRSGFADSVRQRTIKELNGSLSHAALLASKTTALVVPLIDTGHRGTPKIEREIFVPRWTFGRDPWIAQRLLQSVGARQLVLDGGHDNITQIADTLRRDAELFGRGPYADLDEDSGESDANTPIGFVRSGDDAETLGLQIADVAAGFGRTLLQERGFLELTKIFRCVVYNGHLLQGVEAVRLDEEILQHQRVVMSGKK